LNGGESGEVKKGFSDKLINFLLDDDDDEWNYYYNIH
jgi:hypothetical protein